MGPMEHTWVQQQISPGLSCSVLKDRHLYLSCVVMFPYHTYTERTVSNKIRTLTPTFRHLFLDALSTCTCRYLINTGWSFAFWYLLTFLPLCFVFCWQKMGLLLNLSQDVSFKQKQLLPCYRKCMNQKVRGDNSSLL